jgi:hypothetical protein
MDCLIVGRAVPQVVHADRRQPGLADQMVEAAGQEVRVQRRPVLGDEHVTGVLPRLARRALLVGFEDAVAADRFPVSAGVTGRQRVSSNVHRPVMERGNEQVRHR